MLQIHIPGTGSLELQSLVLDFNGTIAADGKLIHGVKERLLRLTERLNVFILTADTNGTARKECDDLPVSVHIIGQYEQAEEKARFIANLQGNAVVIGNGRNDAEMFSRAELAIAIIGEEGCYSGTLLESDIVTKHINDALELLINTNRLIATLRN